MPKLSQYFHCICIDLPGHGANHLALASPDLARLPRILLIKSADLVLSSFICLDIHWAGVLHCMLRKTSLTLY
ncbi:hypothetical protein ACNH6B_17770 [Shewanella basaltis]|uniref:hypothetical protein n=1 Tax=Shewanella basaltis TaxID=472183 RepID=UPI003AB0EB5D